MASSSSNPRVLLLGVGQLGLPILQHLAQRLPPSSLSTLLRPGSSSVSLVTPLGASIVYGDIPTASEAELARLFAPFHTVIGCTGMTFPAGTQTKLAAAAIQAKVKRYIPWQFGVDYDAMAGGSAQDLFTEQLDVRKLLKEHEHQTVWIIFSVGMFMEFLFEPVFGVVDLQKPRVRCLGSWENEVSVTCVEDIGRVVAAVLTKEGEGRVTNEVVWVAGDTVSYEVLAKVVQSVTGREVERVDGSLKLLDRELVEEPDNGLRKYRVAFAEGVGVSWNKETTWNVKNGMELLDLETWLKQRG